VRGRLAGRAYLEEQVTLREGEMRGMQAADVAAMNEGDRVDHALALADAQVCGRQPAASLVESMRRRQITERIRAGAAAAGLATR
jgi:hypothetical protein